MSKLCRETRIAYASQSSRDIAFYLRDRERRNGSRRKGQDVGLGRFVGRIAKREMVRAGEQAIDKFVIGHTRPRKSLRSAQPHERMDDLRPDVRGPGLVLRAIPAAVLGLAACAIQDTAKSASPGWIVAVVVALLAFHISVFRWLLIARKTAYTNDFFFPTRKLFLDAFGWFGPARVTLIALLTTGLFDLLSQLVGASSFFGVLTSPAFAVALGGSLASAIMLGNSYTRGERERYDNLWDAGITQIETLDDGRLKWHLDEQIGESGLPNLQQRAEREGYTITDYDLVGRLRSVELTPVSSDEMSIYLNAARTLNKRVYEFGLEFEWVENDEPDREAHPERLETLTFHRYPIIGLTPEDREKYFRPLIASLPKASDGWTITDDPSKQVKVLRYGKPLKFEDIIPYDWDARPDYKGVPFAVDLKGEVVSLSLIESNMSFGGVPGAGKSGGLTVLITGCALLENVALVGLDPKKVEQAMWRPRFSHIATELDDALATLYALADEMDSRYDRLVEEGRKKVSVDMISPEMPLIVVVADEMAELVAMGISKEEKAADQDRISKMQRLVQKGRAAGIVFVGATQKPAAEVIPTRLRDLVQQRVAYATTTPAMTDTILGTGMSSNGGLAHEIEHDEKGVCFIVNESSRIPVKARTMWIPDEDVAGIAANTAHMRVPLPFLEESLEAWHAGQDGDADPLPKRSAPTMTSAPINLSAPAETGTPDVSDIFNSDRWKKD